MAAMMVFGARYGLQRGRALFPVRLSMHGGGHLVERVVLGPAGVFPVFEESVRVVDPWSTGPLPNY